MAGETTQLNQNDIDRHSRANALPLTREQILRGIGRAQPKSFKERAEWLASLKQDGLILKTGAINPDHPQVTAWLKSPQAMALARTSQAKDKPAKTKKPPKARQPTQPTKPKHRTPSA